MEGAMSAWNSIEYLEAIHRYLKYGPVLLTALAVSVALLSVFLGNRIDFLKSQRDRRLAEELTSARAKLSEVEAKQAPRQLTGSQMDALIERLKPVAGTLYDIATVVGDADGYQYALQFIEVLQAAGWRGRIVPNLSHARPAPVGVRVAIRSRDRIPTAAQLLLDSLLDVGVEDVGGVVDSTAREDQVQIRIGFKSVPPRQ